MSLVGFVVIVVISLTLWMHWYRCVSEAIDYPCVVTVCKREKAERAHNCRVVKATPHSCSRCMFL